MNPSPAIGKSQVTIHDVMYQHYPAIFPSVSISNG